MLPRERVIAALEFRSPDVVPLRIFPAAGGLYEHGQKLVDLIRECGHDFGDLSNLELPPAPPPEDFDADGRYHAFRTDEWGTRWEYRIFGIWGHPVEWPLNDWTNLATYSPPLPPPAEGPAVEAAREAAARHKERYYLLAGGGPGLLEKLISLRRFEEVLMDIALDTPEINRLTDLLAEHAAGWVKRALAEEADGVIFGDDFGAENAPLVSPERWRRFFKPRYAALFEPIRRAGKHLFFHSCGQLGPLIEDLRELGVHALWPQLPAYDLPSLAQRCRRIGLALELHPDRGELMQRGTPRQVRDYVHRLVELFGTWAGGSWLYLEVDPHFPWPNVVALFETAMELRSQAGSRG